MESSQDAACKISGCNYSLGEEAIFLNVDRQTIKCQKSMRLRNEAEHCRTTTREVGCQEMTHQSTDWQMEHGWGWIWSLALHSGNVLCEGPAQRGRESTRVWRAVMEMDQDRILQCDCQDSLMCACVYVHVGLTHRNSPFYLGIKASRFVPSEILKHA